jgi:hypothetical protein
MPVVVSIVWLNILIVLFLAGLAWSIGCWLWAAIVGAIRRRP